VHYARGRNQFIGRIAAKIQLYRLPGNRQIKRPDVYPGQIAG
jgi:hypothetical protein